MSATKSRVSVHIRVDENLDREISRLAAGLRRKGIDKTDIYELGARIVLALVRARKVPDDLGELLSQFDPRALDELRELVKKVKSVEG